MATFSPQAAHATGHGCVVFFHTPGMATIPQAWLQQLIANQRSTSDAAPPTRKPGKKPRDRKAKTPLIRMLKPGACVANCTKPNCPRGVQPILEFAPAVSNITHKKRAKFLKIAKALEDACKDTDVAKLLEQMGKLRNKLCQTCRLIKKKSRENPKTKRGACRAKWYEIRAQLQKQGCILCGRNDAMTVEHTKPKEKMRDKKGNPVDLGDYSKWPTLGGAEAMQAEFDKPSVVPMCRNCQEMQPTHSAMKTKINPKDLPNGKKKNKLVYKRDKQAYVDAKKLEIGKCEDCDFRVVPWGSNFTPGVSGYPHAFQWAHRSELDKGEGVGDIVTSGLSFATCKPLLDKDMARSRLLCQCCGKNETDLRKNAPGPSEEGN